MHNIHMLAQYILMYNRNRTIIFYFIETVCICLWQRFMRDWCDCNVDAVCFVPDMRFIGEREWKKNGNCWKIFSVDRTDGIATFSVAQIILLTENVFVVLSQSDFVWMHSEHHRFQFGGIYSAYIFSTGRFSFN